MRGMTVKELEKAVEDYPWFHDARISLSAHTEGMRDPVLGLHFIGRPVPDILLTDPARADFFKTSLTEEVIERFLSRNYARIVPAEHGGAGTEDISLASVSEDPDICSEELAEIYLTQGLKSKARDIYGKLSLLYPEKSIYFAELIERTNADN